jgi:hypothetical protein
MLAASACGGSTTAPTSPVGISCGPGAQVQLAAPTPNQTAVPTNVGNVTIVADSKNNTLSSATSSFFLTLTPAGGTPVIAGALNTVNQPAGAPQPFTTDFYYQSNLAGSLPAGQTWTVTLNQNLTGQTCPAVTVGTFST